MGLRLRIALLMCLAAAAAWSAAAAYESLRPPEIYALPEEVYAGYMENEAQARFTIKASGEYVAVYSGSNDRTPFVTDIELSALRAADRAMLELGIPVRDREELLALLEDLGS